MKRITSLALSLTIFATSVTPSMAFAPSDVSDPECIDIRELGITKSIISLPKDKNDRNICGCNTCKVDALTFDQLIPYIDELAQRVRSMECVDIHKYKKHSKCEIQQKEKNNAINHIIVILRLIQIYVREKVYQDRNYFFVSTNNIHNKRDSFIAFMTKNDIIVDPKFDDAFFQNVSDYAKKILKEIESGQIAPKMVDVKQPSKAWIGLGIAIPTAIAGALMWKHLKPSMKNVGKKIAQKLEGCNNKGTQTD